MDKLITKLVVVFAVTTFCVVITNTAFAGTRVIQLEDGTTITIITKSPQRDKEYFESMYLKKKKGHCVESYRHATNMRMHANNPERTRAYIRRTIMIANSQARWGKAFSANDERWIAKIAKHIESGWTADEVNENCITEGWAMRQRTKKILHGYREKFKAQQLSAQK